MSVKIGAKNVDTVALANAIIGESPSARAMGIPTINNDASNMATVATSLNNYTAVMNEIQDVLVNKIIFTIVKTAKGMKIQDIFRKGIVPVGYTIEAIYNDLIMDNVEDYKVDATASEFFSVKPGNVQTAFFNRNFRKKVRLTINRDALAAAFVSPENLERFISGQIETLTETMNQYIFVTFKELIAGALRGGFLKPITVTPITDKDSAEGLTVEERTMAMDMTITSTDKNLAGVYQRNDIQDLYLITKTRTLALQDVYSLAAAYNMDKATFIADKVIYIDDFGEDTDDVVAILVSKDFFQIWQNLYSMNTWPDPATLNYQYYLHEWDWFFVSPFEQGASFVTTAPTVTAVTVTPAGPTLPKGSTTMFSADITGTGFPFGQVKWAVEGNTDPNTQIKNGLLYIGMNEGSSITVKATSAQDDTKNGTSTVTVS